MQLAPATKLNRRVRLGQKKPAVDGIGAIFICSRVHNSIGVRNERTKFTLSDKHNWLGHDAADGTIFLPRARAGDRQGIPLSPASGGRRLFQLRRKRPQLGPGSKLHAARGIMPLSLVDTIPLLRRRPLQ